MEESRDASPERDRFPANRVTSEGLRKVELAVFGLLLLALSGFMIWRGVGFLLQGEARFPILGFTLPEPMGYITGAFYLLLASGLAVATLVMVVRFRK